MSATSAIATGIRTAGAVSPALAGRLAFPLFMRVGRRTPVAPADRATHDAARRGTVRIPGLRRTGVDVVTYEWGSGADTVVLAHGWQSRASVFAPLVRELRSEGFRVIAFDAPANGDSPGRGTYLVDHLDIIAELQQRHGAFHAIVGPLVRSPRRTRRRARRGRRPPRRGHRRSRVARGLHRRLRRGARPRPTEPRRARAAIHRPALPRRPDPSSATRRCGIRCPTRPRCCSCTTATTAGCRSPSPSGWPRSTVRPPGWSPQTASATTASCAPT